MSNAAFLELVSHGLLSAIGVAVSIQQVPKYSSSTLHLIIQWRMKLGEATVLEYRILQTLQRVSTSLSALSFRNAKLFDYLTIVL